MLSGCRLPYPEQRYLDGFLLACMQLELAVIELAAAAVLHPQTAGGRRPLRPAVIPLLSLRSLLIRMLERKNIML